MGVDSNPNRHASAASATSPPPFYDKPGDATCDHLLRTTRTLHQQQSAMADSKASIMITVTSIILTVLISQLDKPGIHWIVLTAGSFAIGALLLAILAVLPRFGHPKTPDGSPDVDSPFFNLLFFGHMAQLDLATYEEQIQTMMANHGSIYLTIVRDIHVGSIVLMRKFKRLRWSYICFMLGVVTTAVETIVMSALGLL